MRDYMLVTRLNRNIAPFIADAFPKVIDELKQSVTLNCPFVQWKAEFDLGKGQHVEIFSAPDTESARKVSKVAAAMEALRVDVTPLASSW